MIYELTDTNTEMTEEATGASLGVNPVFVIVADTPAAALQAWGKQHGRGTNGVTVKEVGA